MQINTPEVIDQGNTFRIQSCIEHGTQADSLWYEMDQKYKPYLTTKLDGFLVACLPRAMEEGEDIYVDGTVSETLLYNLTSAYTHLLRIVSPELKHVEIRAKSLDDGLTSACANAVGTGFSAGIDSFCVLVDHFLMCPYPHYRITHCVFNNVGAHGSGSSEVNRRLFHDRFGLIRPCLEEIGMPVILVDSNLSEFLKMNFQKTHVPRNLSSILMLQGLFGKYLYASTYRYQDCYFGETYDIAHTDPAAVHLLSTETLRCISSGCQYSRVRKTEKVSQWDLAKRYLNVCVNAAAQGRNCSLCMKCSRTLLTLELLGKLDLFKDLFDLEKFRAERNRFLLNCFLNKDDAFCKEIANLFLEKEKEIAL